MCYNQVCRRTGQRFRFSLMLKIEAIMEDSKNSNNVTIHNHYYNYRPIIVVSENEDDVDFGSEMAFLSKTQQTFNDEPQPAAAGLRGEKKPKVFGENFVKKYLAQAVIPSNLVEAKDDLSECMANIKPLFPHIEREREESGEVTPLYVLLNKGANTIDNVGATSRKIGDFLDVLISAVKSTLPFALKMCYSVIAAVFVAAIYKTILQ